MYSLATEPYSAEMTQRTASEALVLMYLRLRLAKGQPGATREQIILDTGVSDRTLDRALTRLKREGAIERSVIWTATPFELAE